jgi:transcriptional regulator with XRE-family HTH domain
MKTDNIGQRIRSMMDRQGLTVADLTERTGIESGILVPMLETDITPSIGPLVKISRALGIRLGTLIDDQISRDPLVVRQSERCQELSMLRGRDRPVSQRFFSLGKGKKDRHMEPFFVEILPESATEKTLSSHEGEEFFVVDTGSVEVIYGRETMVLAAGDSIHFNAIVPHYVSCAGDQPATIYAVLYLPD